MGEKEVIILNKVFEGAWNEEEGNISHEIIDFVLSDDGGHFIYNTPHGICPDYIYVDPKNNDEEKYKATYMLLTGTTKTIKGTGKHRFPINYCIKLEKKLHNKHSSKSEEAISENRDEIIKICKEYNIKYNCKYLHEIYKNDKSLLVTFKAEKMWKAKKPIVVEVDYNLQRNKGYIKSDKHSQDFDMLSDIIKETTNWEEFKPSNVNANNHTKNAKKNFLDLILKVDSEECYTNILYSVLKQGDLLNKFCNQFKKKELRVSDKPFTVLREQGIVEGRMDVCAENEEQRVVIENKVFSGLNGIHKDETTQLRKYYEWAKERNSDPLCFLTAPDHREEEIKAEISRKDPNMKDIYEFVGYSKIESFLNNNLSTLKDDDYEFCKYAEDFIDIFHHHAHKSKQEYYNNLFLQAIMNAE